MENVINWELLVKSIERHREDLAVKGGYDKSYALYKEARDHMEMSDFTKAAQLFEESMLLHFHPKAAELLGVCLREIGLITEAIEMLRIATQHGKESKAPMLLSELLRKVGAVDEAVHYLDVSLTRNPTYGPSLLLRKKWKA